MASRRRQFWVGNSRITTDDGAHVSICKKAINVTMLVALLGVASCSHKLISHGGETTISVFPSKKDFDDLMSMKSQGGVAGMAAGIRENFIAKKVAENTPVKVLASDSEGNEVQILEGPEAGLRGYVAKDNLD